MADGTSFTPVFSMNAAFAVDCERDAASGARTCQWVLPASPDSAPDVIDLSEGALGSVLDALWRDTFGPDGSAKEQSAILCVDSSGLVALTNWASGTEHHIEGEENLLVDGLDFLGIAHTHTNASPLSGTDLAGVVTAPQALAIVQAGDKQYMVVRTAQSPGPDTVDVEATRQRIYDVLKLVKQHGTADIIGNKLVASRIIAAELGLAYYVSNGDGVFRRIPLDCGAAAELQPASMSCPTGTMPPDALERLVRSTVIAQREAAQLSPLPVYTPLSPLLAH